MAYALIGACFVAGLLVGGLIMLCKQEDDDVLLLDERVTHWPPYPEWPGQPEWKD